MRRAVIRFIDTFTNTPSKFTVFRLGALIGDDVAFEYSDVPLYKVLVGLNRLIPLAKEAGDVYEGKKVGESSVFIPININIENINVHIVNALDIVSSSSDIGPDTKTTLIEYLEDIRFELTKKTPLWRKVVGGLVIVAAILGGIAVAPQAVENVQKAIHELIGPSIEKGYRYRVPEYNAEMPKLIEA